MTTLTPLTWADFRIVREADAFVIMDRHGQWLDYNGHGCFLTDAGWYETVREAKERVAAFIEAGGTTGYSTESMRAEWEAERDILRRELDPF